MAAAEKHFADAGYDGSRVDAIAATAGVSKSHLYYHFPTKQELLSGLIDLRTADLLEAKDRLFARARLDAALGDADSLAGLLAEAFATLLQPHRRFVRIMLVEAIRNPEATRPVFAAVNALLDDTLHRFRDMGIELDERAKSLWFHYGVIPSLYLVALDADPTGFDGGATALAPALARAELALLAILREET